MRSEQTLLPDWRLRSSGSRVRFPVRTTRLMLVAAMVGRLSFRHFELSDGESTAGLGGIRRNRRFLRTIVTKSAQSARERAQSAFRYPVRSGAAWRLASRARGAQPEASQQLERFSTVAKQRSRPTRRRDRKTGGGGGRRESCQYCRDKVEFVDYKDINL